MSDWNTRDYGAQQAARQALRARTTIDLRNGVTAGEFIDALAHLLDYLHDEADDYDGSKTHIYHTIYRVACGVGFHDFRSPEELAGQRA